jgi:hypothetical protein
MATVLEECNTEEQCSAVRFVWAEWLNAKDIHKEIFPAYVGKCLSRKAVQNWIEEFSQRRSKFADDARPSRPVAQVAHIIVEILLCCGFRRTGKAMAQVYQCWWRICGEINVSSRFENHMFYTHLWLTDWLSLVYIYMCVRESACACVCFIPVGWETRPPLSSSGQSSWLQIQRSGFDSRRYQIFSEK